MLRILWSNKNIAIVKVLIILPLVFVTSFSMQTFGQALSDLEQANLYFSNGQYTVSFRQAGKKLNLSGSVGSLECIAVVPGHPAVGI